MITITKLSNYNNIKNQIKIYEEKLEELNAQVLSSSKFDSEKTFSSKETNPVENLMLSVISLKRKYVDQLNNLYKKENEIIDFIMSIDDEEIKLIIDLRFLKQYSWNDIGKVLYMHRTSPYYKLKRHLEKYNEKLKGD